MGNRLCFILRLSIAALVPYAFASPLLAQSISEKPSPGQQVETLLYIRGATPQEVFGVWEILPDPGSQYRGYQAIMADGRCAYLLLKIQTAEEPSTLTGSEVIKQLDSQTDKESPNSWRPCLVTEGGGVTEAAHGTNIETYYALRIVTNVSEGAKAYDDRRNRPGDIISQQYYKPNPNPPPSVHLMLPAPIRMRRVAD